MRRVEVYDSGDVLYYKPANTGAPTRAEIGASDVKALVQLVKSFPIVEEGGAMEDFVGSYKKGKRPKDTSPTAEGFRHRGTTEDLKRLIAEVSKRAHLTWEQVPKSAARNCDDRGYTLPDGGMILREDLKK